eukprot:3941593-Rhodomonas_salina.3
MKKKLKLKKKNLLSDLGIFLPLSRPAVACLHTFVILVASIGREVVASAEINHAGAISAYAMPVPDTA